MTPQKPEMLLQEKFVEITYDAENQVIVAKWIGFLNLDQVKQGCKVLNEHIRSKRLTKHLSNQTRLKVLSKEVQGHLTGVWFEEVEKMGLRKIAVLMAEDIFAKATVDKVNTAGAYKEMNINSFGGEQQCYNWLNN